jgi:hypothetical protein
VYFYFAAVVISIVRIGELTLIELSPKSKIKHPAGHCEQEGEAIAILRRGELTPFDTTPRT